MSLGRRASQMSPIWHKQPSLAAASLMCACPSCSAKGSSEFKLASVLWLQLAPPGLPLTESLAGPGHRGWVHALDPAAQVWLACTLFCMSLAADRGWPRWVGQLRTGSRPESSQWPQWLICPSVLCHLHSFMETTTPQSHHSIPEGVTVTEPSDWDMSLTRTALHAAHGDCCLEWRPHCFPAGPSCSSHSTPAL